MQRKKLSYEHKIMDISVYRKNPEEIQLRIDVIFFKKLTDEPPLEKLHEKILNTSLYEPYLVYNDRKNILQELLYQTNLNDEMFTKIISQHDEIIDQNLETYQRSSVIYTLSKSPHVVLNWLGCLCYFLDSIDGMYHALHISNNVNADNPFLRKNNPSASVFDDESEDNEINERSKDYIMIRQYAGKDPNYLRKANCFRVLLETIQSLKMDQQGLDKSSDVYLNVFNDLQKVIDEYKDPGKFFLGCICVENRINAKQLEKCLANDVPESDKLNSLLEMGRKYIDNHQQSELHFILASINFLIRKNLFKRCIGQKAHDGHPYCWKHTEWDFLKHAEFALKDGRISIINLEKNIGYQKLYAQGKPNHAIFADEINHLAKTLSLEFDANCNFHSELIFNQASSDALKKLGVHLTANYVKNELMTIQNNFKLFTPCKIHESTKDVPKKTENVGEHLYMSQSLG